MIQPVLLSTLLLSTAIALIHQPARALCLEEGSISVERDDEESFVRSSPASSESEFKFEVDLSDLTSSESPDEAEAMPAEEKPMTDQAEQVDLEPVEESTSDISPAVDDFDAEATSDADVLGILEADEPLTASREDYLNEMAENLNNCL